MEPSERNAGDTSRTAVARPSKLMLATGLGGAGTADEAVEHRAHIRAHRRRDFVVLSDGIVSILLPSSSPTTHIADLAI